MAYTCADRERLERIEQKLDRIERQQEEIVSAQDDINTAVAAIQGVVTDLAAAVTNIQTEIAALSSQGVDTTGLTAAVAQLQGVQATVDALETPPAA